MWKLWEGVKHPEGGGAHKMGGGQMISPQNGGSVDAIDHFWGKCSSKLIFLGGVEIKLVDFGGSVVPFQENLGEEQHFIKKVPEWGEVGICSRKMEGFQSLKRGEVTYIWTQLWEEGR